MNIEAPQISVIITCYNYGHYLAGAVESVLAQTRRDFEVVVIDDGSTDHTPAVMAAYRQNSRIRYFRRQNGGQARAKNMGVRLSRGRFLAFLDADDLWTEDKLARQLPLFADPRVGVVYSGAGYIDAAGNLLKSKPLSRYLQPRSGEVISHLFLDNFVLFSSSMVRRECFERLGGFDEDLPMGIDWDLWLRFSVAYDFAYAESPLLLYRVGHPGQMSKNIEERQRCSDRIMQKFLEEHPGLLSRRLIKEAYCYTHLNRGYYFRKMDPKRSVKHYLSALKYNVLQKRAYAGLLKTCVVGGMEIANKKHY